MNSYIFLHRIRPLICSPVLNNLRSSSKSLVSVSKLSSKCIWRSPLCFVNQNQSFKYDVSIRPYVSQATTNAEELEYKKLDQSRGWIAERVLSFMTLMVIPIAFETPCELTECIACIIISIHLHWGLESTLTDYLRPSVVGHTISKYVDLYSYAISIFILAGLIWCASYDNGVIKTIQQLWYLDLDINPYER